MLCFIHYFFQYELLFYDQDFRELQIPPQHAKELSQGTARQRRITSIPHKVHSEPEPDRAFNAC